MSNQKIVEMMIWEYKYILLITTLLKLLTTKLVIAIYEPKWNSSLNIFHKVNTKCPKELNFMKQVLELLRNHL